MFAKVGKYKPCGIFTLGHFILMAITGIGIMLALKCSTTKEKVYKIIKRLTIIMCILEVFKIIYSISQTSIYAVNEYMPLYYCSMLLYAGLLSSFGKGKFKRTGDVFLATGSIIGGLIFILYPSTSLPAYPAFHIISIHSFLFHGIMVYLGILVNKTHYIELEKNDIKYFASLVGIMCIVALIMNNIFDSNLMFISKNFPGMPIEILYNMTNGTILFTLIMCIGQMTLPFYISYYIVKKINEYKSKKQENCECLESSEMVCAEESEIYKT